MCSRGVLVHYLSRLGATTAVLAVEVPRGDGVSTQWALERVKTLHHLNGVMSHSLKSSRLSRYECELKLSSHLLGRGQTYSQPYLNKHLR
jgi:hypothetical protein